MSRPRILDLFCGAGGAAVGYHRAGFDVVGVDINPQPDYPFTFWQCAFDDHSADEIVQSFDAVHASPPCQNQAAITRGTNAHLRDRYPDLHPAVRDLLDETGLPYVIENPIARADVVLCGEMFGLGVIRHRNFELGGWAMPRPAHLKHRGKVRGWRHGVYSDGPYVAGYGAGGGKATADELRVAMEMPWVNERHGLIEAIPPAYTEHIGRALIEHLERPSADVA